MTTLRRVAAVALTVLAGWTPLRAQEPEASAGGTAVVRAEQPADCEGGPIAVVAQFLGLTPDQLPVLEQALRERQQTLAPILQGIAMREQRIRELVASGGNPAEIGAGPRGRAAAAGVARIPGAPDAVEAATEG